MIKSMTGFGRGKAESENYRLSVEIKSVNHRFLELSLRLPKTLSSQEDALKKQLQSVLNRGKVDVFVTLEAIGVKKTSVTVDKELAIAYYNALSELAATLEVECLTDLQQLAAFNGVLRVEAVADDEEEIAALLLQAATQAGADLLRMRELEGTALAADLLSHLSRVDELAAEIGAQAPLVVIAQRQRLEQRLGELLGSVEIDQSKLANEVAFFADKADISEELTRLASHSDQFRQSLRSEDAIGRKLEFILQEMLREINTIGSKSNALDINRIVIEVKSELEKIREQIQNVE